MWSEVKVVGDVALRLAHSPEWQPRGNDTNEYPVSPWKTCQTHWLTAETREVIAVGFKMFGATLD
jgi:hypothetical protein